MSLDFLSPRPNVASPARSAMLDAAIAGGATTTVRNGWEVVDSFGDPEGERALCTERAGFADRSDLGKLELQLGAGASPSDLTPGRAERDGDVWRCPVRPDRELLLCDASVTSGLRSSLGVPTEGRRECDVTAAYSALTVAGPLAREVFAQFCALDLREASLPVGGFRPGSVARNPGFVLREGPERFLVLSGTAYAQFVWETVALAAATVGGGPVGDAALPALGEESADA
jgi:heterotetrameric sarcosine oxidase gamma subunit